MDENIFAAAQKVENIAMSVGRKQMCIDILRLLVDNAEQLPHERLAAVIELCNAEAFK